MSAKNDDFRTWSIRLPNELYHRFRRIARDERRSLSRQGEIYIAAGVKQHETQTRDETEAA